MSTDKGGIDGQGRPGFEPRSGAGRAAKAGAQGIATEDEIQLRTWRREMGYFTKLQNHHYTGTHTSDRNSRETESGKNNSANGRREEERDQ
jgi:hypothetical protein